MSRGHGDAERFVINALTNNARLTGRRRWWTIGELATWRHPAMSWPDHPAAPADPADFGRTLQRQEAAMRRVVRRLERDGLIEIEWVTYRVGRYLKVRIMRAALTARVRRGDGQ